MSCYQYNIKSMGYYVYVLLLSACWLWRISLMFQPIRNRKMFWMNNNAKSFETNFFFLFIGREPTTWPANNCLQIMVCSCAMPSNCVLLQLMFCSCIKETVLSPSCDCSCVKMADCFISQGYSLKKQTRWSTDKTWLSQNIMICQCLADQLFASAFGCGK